jgi:hypothetical protein
MGHHAVRETTQDNSGTRRGISDGAAVAACCRVTGTALALQTSDYAAL